MLETQLAGNLPDLRFLLAGDGIVGGRDGEQTIEQLAPLDVARDLLELARDEEVLGAAEQQILALGDLRDEQGLLFRQAAHPLKDLDNLVHFDDR